MIGKFPGELLESCGILTKAMETNDSFIAVPENLIGQSVIILIKKCPFLRHLNRSEKKQWNFKTFFLVIRHKLWKL